MEAVVIALGGNAILRQGERGTVREQLANIRATCEHLLPLLREDRALIFTHGNGPQVGNLLVSLEATQAEFPLMPLDVCGAMTQGSIGYMIQRTLANLLNEHAIRRAVVTVVTQVVVDPRDDAFWGPTKPVGPHYGAEEAQYLARTKGWRMIEDAGRGYRRVVASPEPMEIVERSLIRQLALGGAIVIAAGGGGIPVVRSGDGTLIGIEGVIDKDRASVQLALDAGAERLLILTAVDQVFLDYGQPTAKPVDRLTRAEAERLLAEGQFPPGSMGPKIEGAIRFLKEGGREAVISSPEQAHAALSGAAGTHLVP